MSTRQSSASRYSRGAIAFHWTIAALILANITIGLLHEDMARETRRFWMGQHFAIGLAVLVLSVGRVGWRLAYKPPAPLMTQAAWERVLARAVHVIFYLLIIALPVLGWLAVSTGRAESISFFGLFEMPVLPVARSDGAHSTLETVHGLLGKIMLGLIVLHVIGALKHHILDRDLTLARMIPFIRG